jgi:tetratricopeptide (TPR) repeat protein
MNAKFFYSLFFSFLFLTAIAQNTLIESGKIKQHAGNHTGAIEDFTSAINQHADEVKKFLKMLDDYNAISSFEKEENGLEIPKTDENFAVPYYLRGYSYSVTGKNTEAMSDFTTAIKINPKLGAAYYERGKLLWAIGKRDEGCIDLGMAASLKDTMGQEMYDEKFCWKEAVNAAREAHAKIMLSDFKAALDLIEKAVKLCPDSANYLGLRGRAYFGLGKTSLVMQDFDKAIAMKQKSFDAYLGRGMMFYSKNMYQEAFDDLSKALAINDKEPDAYLYRAYACEGMQKNQSAIFDYSMVQKLKPADALAFYKSALLKLEMGDTAGACREFRRAASMGHSEAQDYVSQKCGK